MHSKRKQQYNEPQEKKEKKEDEIKKHAKISLKDELALLKIKAEEDKIRFKQFHNESSILDTTIVTMNDELYLYVSRRNFFHLKNLLLAGVDPNQSRNSLLGIVCTSFIHEPFGRERAKMLIAFGADLNIALEYVTSWPMSVESVEFLLEAGASISGSTGNNSILINALKECGSFEARPIVQYLLARPEIDLSLNIDIIPAAVEGDNLTLLKQVVPIFEHKDPINFQQAVVESLQYLFWRKANNTNMIEYLLGLKPDLSKIYCSKKTNHKINLLMDSLLTINGFTFTDKIIELGSDIRMTINGNNLLHRIPCSDVPEVNMVTFIEKLPVELLFEKNNEGQIPLQVACSVGAIDYINLYLTKLPVYCHEYDDCFVSLFASLRSHNSNKYPIRLLERFFSIGCNPVLSDNFLSNIYIMNANFKLYRLLMYYGYTPRYHAPNKKKIATDDKAFVIDKLIYTICSSLTKNTNKPLHHFCTQGVYDPRIFSIIYNFTLSR